jgi:hypothetical protein
MDMPEGWSRLEERVKQGYENHSSDKDLAKMVYICKEMAEVLELCSKEVQPYMRSNPEYIPTDNAKKAIDILNKFKELK